MEFNEKLQELRKQKGLTQEELAKVLYVSRTAISKWESGRGYPNIDSLKAISKKKSIFVIWPLVCLIVVWQCSFSCLYLVKEWMALSRKLHYSR